MYNYSVNILSLLFLTLVSSCLSAETQDESAENRIAYFQSKPASQISNSVYQVLSKVVNDGKAPGMIAAIISNEGVIAIGSAGERKTGSGISFKTNDYVHLSSCTKAMTSTMITTLVAEGKLDWESKLIDVIPELKGSIHADYHEITLSRYGSF